MNFGNSHIEDHVPPECDKYMVSPNQGMISESFDNNALQKATTIDGTYKSINGKIISNQGISGNINKSNSQYGISEEAEGVATSGTWDLRKSSSYVSKAYSKNPKQATYTKKQVSYHKKNKSQHNSRIVPTRASSSLASYNFNTNRSNLSKGTKKESSIRKNDSEKKLSLKHTSKGVKQKSGRYPTYHPKTEQYLKNYPINKKNVSSSHVRNMSAMATHKS